MINQERMIAEFIELVKIKCSTNAEREVGDVVKAKLSTLGLEVYEDDVAGKIGGNCGNVIGFLKGNGEAVPTLMLSAHLDSVEPCGGIKPQIVDGVIKSQGDTILGADDKAGVVTILEVCAWLRKTIFPMVISK